MNNITNIQSKLIVGLSATAFTERRLLQLANAPSGAKITHMVFQTILDSRKYYSCWVDGIVENGKVRMTAFGQAAVEALCTIPWDTKKILVNQEMIVGPTPLRKKIIHTFRKIPKGARVCFVGDLSGELNGRWDEALGVTGMIDLARLNRSKVHSGA